MRRKAGRTQLASFSQARLRRCRLSSRRLRCKCGGWLVGAARRRRRLGATGRGGRTRYAHSRDGAGWRRRPLGPACLPCHGPDGPAPDGGASPDRRWRRSVLGRCWYVSQSPRHDRSGRAPPGGRGGAHHSGPNRPVCGLRVGTWSGRSWTRWRSAWW